MNFREIYEGWKNDLTPEDKLADSIKELAAYRIEICRGCEFNSINAPREKKSLASKLRADEHCTNCGCPLAKKTKSPKSKCPLDPPKWDAVITDKEQTEIKTIIDSI